MKNLFVAYLFILICSTISFGKFAILPLEDRIKNTDLIIVGTLESVSERETYKFNYYQGNLIIEKIIFGNVKTTQGLSLTTQDKLQVKWQNSNMVSCRLMFAENYKKIWFLQTDADGNIESLTPSSTALISDITKIKNLLKKQKRSDKKVNIVKTQNDSKEIPQSITVKENVEEVIKDISYKEESKQKEYAPLFALFVISASIMLFYLLYRSRFKIR